MPGCSSNGRSDFLSHLTMLHEEILFLSTFPCIDLFCSGSVHYVSGDFFFFLSKCVRRLDFHKLENIFVKVLVFGLPALNLLSSKA